jgi:hypothetical protein
MAIFNVRHGPFRSLPAVEPGQFLIAEDENALYCDLVNEDDPNDIFRVRIGDFQVVNSLEELALNSNKSDHALYYIKPHRNEYGIESGNVLARYDESTNKFYQINTDTGVTSAEVYQLNDPDGFNLLTDVRYDPDTRKLSLILGARAPFMSEFNTLAKVVDRINGDENTQGSFRNLVKVERERATEVESVLREDVDNAQASADTAQETVDSLISGEFSDAKSDIQTLLGSDKSSSNRATKSIRTIASEELTERLIPDNAKEALDTLQEIANWIQEHPDEASAMNTAIQNLKAYVGVIPNEAYSGDIVNYISEHSDGVVSSLKGSAVIATESDGIVTIKSGIKENDGKVSNKNDPDITLLKVAVTGRASDIIFDNGKTLEEQVVDMNDSVQNWDTF